ncbi:hypothetical protein A5742_14520 [Mycolicibacterium fortuitum]|uniref:Amine oxidase domain-containing protein n=1 Tax=Mycolicibacterium fortuitum TaxID=1766 RepID=A0ABD6QC50_MYCFO|nr:FAD-dependent oxidoreductase [Mycolicibacterium fortuitum]OMC33108.1 hypothetical protein A5742_14520 [Mycolicibacterium fortuitum]
MKTYAVVGAGLSGLTAAYRLQQSGANVVVFERNGRAGGRIATERVGRYVVDTGPDALTAGYKSYLELIDELGLTGQVAGTSPVIGLVRGGRIIDIDPKKWWQLPFTPALSLRSKMAMLTGLVRLSKTVRSVDSYDMSRSAELDDPDMTAREFAAQRLGEEAADYLIDPMMRLTVGTGASQASTLNVLGALGAWSSGLLTVTGGLGTVTDRLAERVDVRHGCVVTQIDETPSGVVVSYRDDHGEQSFEADGCVLSAMHDVASEMWPPLQAASPAFGDKLRNVKLISVSLGYSARTRTRAYPVLVPTVENPEALLIFMQHNKSKDRAPKGHSLVTVYTDTSVTDSFLDRTDSQLEKWAADVVERLCPELAGHRDMSVVTRWPKAGYLADPGFWRRSSSLLNSLPVNGAVKVAGDLFGAGSMESAARWGNNAASALIDRR